MEHGTINRQEMWFERLKARIDDRQQHVSADIGCKKHSNRFGGLTSDAHQPAVDEWHAAQRDTCRLGIHLVNTAG